MHRVAVYGKLLEVTVACTIAVGAAIDIERILFGGAVADGIYGRLFMIVKVASSASGVAMFVSGKDEVDLVPLEQGVEEKLYVEVVVGAAYRVWRVMQYGDFPASRRVA